MSDLIADVEIGEQAKAFLQGDLGRYLEGCAQQDLTQAKDELFDLDPYKYTELVALQGAISAIQRKGKIALDVQQYLAEAITNGSQALHQLESTGE